jgi:hypothetical protein
MSVVRAQIQTVEEIYGLVWTAAANKQPIEPATKAGIDYFVHTDWAEIGKDSFAYSATSTAATAGVDSIHWDRLQTGGVLRWRNSVE